MNKRTELKVMLGSVDLLAAAMKKKLRAKARDGFSGGLEGINRHEVAKSLQAHVVRLTGVCPHCESSDGDHDMEEAARQAIDVANLAMMLWVLGKSRTVERT